MRVKYPYVCGMIDNLSQNIRMYAECLQKTLMEFFKRRKLATFALVNPRERRYMQANSWDEKLT